MQRTGTITAFLVLAAGWIVSADAQGIFVPPPRAEGDVLDGARSPAGPVAGSLETVRTLRGSELTGRVVSIDAEGALVLADPLLEFTGQVAAPVRTLELVRLAAATQPEAGPDTVTITNGDCLLGRIVSMDADSVVMDTPSAGQVTIQRRVVAQAAFQGKGGGLALNSDFESGRMDPWKAVQGDWKIVRGRITCSARGDFQALSVRADQQDEPVTVEVAVEGNSMDEPSLIVSVFCDDPEQRMPFGRNSVWVSFDADDDEFSSGTSQNGNQRPLDRQYKDFDKQTMTAKLTYDPKTGRLRYWADGQLMGDVVCKDKPAEGKYITVGSYYPCSISSIRVSGGVLAAEEGGQADSALAKDAHLIQFNNKDRLTVKQVTLADSAFTLTTAAVGEVKCEAEKIFGIVFNATGQQPPRRQANDVIVQTSASRLTFQLKSMDGQWLVGHSDYIGDVKVRRDAVKSVKFNLYSE